MSNIEAPNGFSSTSGAASIGFAPNVELVAGESRTVRDPATLLAAVVKLPFVSRRARRSSNLRFSSARYSSNAEQR